MTASLWPRRTWQPRAFLRRFTVWATALTLPVVMLACGDDETPVEPEFELDELYGIYELEVLRFDPQGTLPAVDVLARADFSEDPELEVVQGGQAQLLWRRSGGLLEVVGANWRLTTTGIRLTLADPGKVGTILLPRELELELSVIARTLSFSGSVSGPSRTQLLALVPEWEQEQLLDPTPGSLTVRFRRPAS